MPLRARRFVPVAALALVAGACNPFRDPTDENDKTELMRAAEAGDAARVRVLLADGARVNQRARDHSGLRYLLAFLAWMQQLPERDGGYTALHYAAEAGGYEGEVARMRGRADGAMGRYRETVAALLDGGADPAATADNGDHPLALAAASGDPGLVRLLLERGAPVRRPEDLSESAAWISPLVAAVQVRPVSGNTGSERIARILLDAGADPNPAEPGPGSLSASTRPIALAAFQGDSTLVALLLARGAEPDPIGQEGVTPLIGAARGGHLSVVRILLAAGADAARRDERAGWTAAQWAANEGHDSIAAVLARADPNAAGEKEIELVHAVQVQDLERVRTLLAEGAMPNTRASHGGSLLTSAVYVENVEIARALLEAGARIDVRPQSGEIPLIHRAAQVGNVELVRLLLEHRASAAAPGTATYAASSGKVEVLQLVERAGANLREDADEPLRAAAIAGGEEAVRYLLSRGAVVDAADGNLRTALSRSVAFDQHEVVRVLLEGGADPRQADPESGWTPLMSAAMGGDSAMIVLLMDAGADPAPRDAQGKNAADYARGAGNGHVVPLLRRRGDD
jgi:ankyrin repeat protein